MAQENTPNTEPQTTEPEAPDTYTREELNKALNNLAARHRKEVSSLETKVAAMLDERLKKPTEGEGDGEMAQLKKQVAAQQKAIEDRERLIAEERAQQLDARSRQQMHEALTSSGIKPELAPFLISHFYADQKKVKAKDSGLYFETGEEIEPEVDFRKWVEKFAKTPTGKHFVAPVQTEGSGTIVGRQTRPIDQGQPGSIAAMFNRPKLS